MKKPFSIVLRILISLILVALVFNRVDFSSLLSLLAEVKIYWWLLGLLLVFLASLLGSYKWQMLANSIFGTTVSLLNFFRFYLIGFFYSLFVPGGLAVGEIMKSWRITRGEEKKPQLVLSVLADRITGFIALAIILPIVFLLGPALQNDGIARLTLLISLGIGTAGILLFSSQTFGRFIANLAGRFIAGVSFFLAYYNLKKVVAISIALGAAVHVLWTLSLWFAVQALGIDAPFLFLLWVYLISGILFFLPISYAGFGVREWTFVYFLGLINISAEQAVALSFLFFGLQVVHALVGGVFEFQHLLKKA